jgi:hypothetical protein
MADRNLLDEVAWVEGQHLDLENYAEPASASPPQNKPIPYLTVPLDWITAAAALPGKAALAAVRIAYLARVRKTKSVKPGYVQLQRHAPRRTIHRGIITLERAGLVSVKRSSGRSLLITLQFDSKFWSHSLLAELEKTSPQH